MRAARCNSLLVLVAATVLTWSPLAALGDTDCTLCPSGFFTFTNCTTSTDRVCAQCRVCSPQTSPSPLYTCGAYNDAVCSNADYSIKVPVVFKSADFDAVFSTPTSSEQTSAFAAALRASLLQFPPTSFHEYELGPITVDRARIIANVFVLHARNKDALAALVQGGQLSVLFDGVVLTPSSVSLESNSSSSGSSTATYIAIGAGVGGGVLVILLVVLLFITMRRRRQRVNRTVADAFVVQFTKPVPLDVHKRQRFQYMTHEERQRSLRLEQELQNRQSKNSKKKAGSVASSTTGSTWTSPFASPVGSPISRGDSKRSSSRYGSSAIEGFRDIHKRLSASDLDPFTPIPASPPPIRPPSTTSSLAAKGYISSRSSIPCLMSTSSITFFDPLQVARDFDGFDEPFERNDPELDAAAVAAVFEEPYDESQGRAFKSKAGAARSINQALDEKDEFGFFASPNTSISQDALTGSEYSESTHMESKSLVRGANGGAQSINGAFAKAASGSGTRALSVDYILPSMHETKGDGFPSSDGRVKYLKDSYEFGAENSDLTNIDEMIDNLFLGVDEIADGAHPQQVANASTATLAQPARAPQPLQQSQHYVPSQASMAAPVRSEEHRRTAFMADEDEEGFYGFGDIETMVLSAIPPEDLERMERNDLVHISESKAAGLEEAGEDTDQLAALEEIAATPGPARKRSSTYGFQDFMDETGEASSILILKDQPRRRPSESNPSSGVPVGPQSTSTPSEPISTPASTPLTPVPSHEIKVLTMAKLQNSTDSKWRTTCLDDIRALMSNLGESAIQEFIALEGLPIVQRILKVEEDEALCKACIKVFGVVATSSLGALEMNEKKCIDTLVAQLSKPALAPTAVQALVNLGNIAVDLVVLAGGLPRLADVLGLPGTPSETRADILRFFHHARNMHAAGLTRSGVAAAVCRFLAERDASSALVRMSLEILQDLLKLNKLTQISSIQKAGGVARLKELKENAPDTAISALAAQILQVYFPYD